MIPIASTAATSTVARTNLVRLLHATHPLSSIRWRAARGASRTVHAQIRLPSARKKYVENSTMKNPATACPRAVPTSAVRVSTPPSAVLSVIASCMPASASLIWVSLALSGPVFSQFRICSMPCTTESARSEAPAATCDPTNVRSSATVAIPKSTTMPAPSGRGTPMPWSRRTTGLTSAAMRSAIANGTVMTAKNASSQRIR